MPEEKNSATFWEHLEGLRLILIKIIIVIVIFSVLGFCFKDLVFNIVLAPKSSDFISYRLLGGDNFDIELINTAITGQFMIHLKVAVLVGIVISSPYIIYALFKFITPALYTNEKKYSLQVVLWAYVMFVVGAAVNYFLIFPLTIRFLGTYMVSNQVSNLLSLSSYMDTLFTMTLLMGIMFEIPVVAWLLCKIGVLKSKWMKKYRKHAIVVILVMAAVITPTSDVFTLTIVFLPIWLLYEVSIWIVGKNEKKDLFNSNINSIKEKG